MDEMTLTALRGSIAKWKAIADGTGIDSGSLNCPLCQEFPDPVCNGCPVAAATGWAMCKHTPYANEWGTLVRKRDGIEYGIMGILAISDEAKAAALAQVAFLESLLPVVISAYEKCPVCNGSGLQSNTFNGEPEMCRECMGNTVVRARDDRGRFVGGSKPK